MTFTMAELGFIFSLVGSVFGAGVMWGILRSKMASMGKRIGFMEDKIDDHEKASSPHLACPAHQVVLDNILDSLKEIKGDIKTMSNQIFNLVKNGSVQKF